MDVSIIIVNWNTKQLLKDCLNSIYAMTKKVKFEIIIVDNASNDDSVKMLKKNFTDCHVIESKKNLGFSKANNAGVRIAKGRYFLFLNPDTKLKSSALEGMVKFLNRNPEYGAIGCKLLNNDGTIQFTCARRFPKPVDELFFLSMLDRVFSKSILFSGSELRYWNHDDSKDVDCLSGACIMTRKEITDQIGGFNERYFMYGEDIELCYRIRNNGWLIRYLADEEIYHFSGSGSNQRRERSFSAVMQREANFMFMCDYYGKRQGMIMRLFVFLGAFIRIIFLIILLPASVFSKRLSDEISINSLKKYYDIFLWSIVRYKLKSFKK